MGLSFKGRKWWIGRLILVAFLGVILSLFSVPAQGVSEEVITSAVSKALTYLKEKQHADGGFGEGGSNFGDTTYVIMAVASAGHDPHTWTVQEKSPLDYLKTQLSDLKDKDKLRENAGRISQLILALVAAGENPRDFSGTDWVTLLKESQDEQTGQFGYFAVTHMWAMLALKAAGEQIPVEAKVWLLQNQEDNGSFPWDFKGSFGGDTNDTALAIQALVAAGEDTSSESIQRALAFLHTQQNDDGGFPWVKPSLWGSDSDSNSDSWVIQGIIAAGEDPQSEDWTINGNNPLDHLLSLQNESGAFRFQDSWPADNLMSTYQAIPALMGKFFPIFFPSQEEPVPSDSPSTPEPTPEPTSEPAPISTEPSASPSSPSYSGSSSSIEVSTETGPAGSTSPVQTPSSDSSQSDLQQKSSLKKAKVAGEKVEKKPARQRTSVSYLFVVLGFLIGAVISSGLIISKIMRRT